MRDNFGREITTMRISVTDRCNLRCKYCMPEKGIKWLSREKILSFEEIACVVREAAKIGITQVRLTGGEPLLRKNICELVLMLKNIEGIDEIALTTNGILLEKFAVKLATNGLDRVNISLDTLNTKKFCENTRGGKLQDVFGGIDAAIVSGINPIKINCVVENNSQEKDAQAVEDFAAQKNLKIRFIKKMNLKSGDFSGVENGKSGNCATCNRLRLLCDGTIKPCLFSDIEFSIRELGAREALLQAIKNKPKMGGSCLARSMHEIGG